MAYRDAPGRFEKVGVSLRCEEGGGHQVTHTHSLPLVKNLQGSLGTSRIKSVSLSPEFQAQE